MVGELVLDNLQEKTFQMQVIMVATEPGEAILP
jgi:hypothetical protein